MTNEKEDDFDQLEDLSMLDFNDLGQQGEAKKTAEDEPVKMSVQFKIVSKIPATLLQKIEQKIQDEKLEVQVALGAGKVSTSKQDTSAS